MTAYVETTLTMTVQLIGRSALGGLHATDAFCDVGDAALEEIDIMTAAIEADVAANKPGAVERLNAHLRTIKEISLLSAEASLHAGSGLGTSKAGPANLGLKLIGEDLATSSQIGSSDGETSMETLCPAPPRLFSLAPGIEHCTPPLPPPCFKPFARPPVRPPACPPTRPPALSKTAVARSSASAVIAVFAKSALLHVIVAPTPPLLFHLRHGPTDSSPSSLFCSSR